MFNKPQPDHLAQLQAEAYKKSIYRELIDPKECEKREIKLAEGSIFSPKSGQTYLPQVKAAMRITSNQKQAEIAHLVHQNTCAKLDHQVNKFTFGEPDSFVMARKMV